MPASSPISDILKSIAEPNSILFVIFIPSKDEDDKALPKGEDQQMWANAAGDLLTELFGGATEMPPAKGKWFKAKGKRIITEEIILVHSYAGHAEAEDDSKLARLAEFLHRMGRRTKQGEVAVLIAGVFHKIRKFTLEEKGK